MIKTLLRLLAILLFAINVQSQNLPSDIYYLDPYNPEYTEGVVLVKFKDDAKLVANVKRNHASSGLESIDQVLEKYEATEIGKVFKTTQNKGKRFISNPAGGLMEVPQLFNIYKLKFASEADAKEIAEELSKDPLVDFAEPDYFVYTMEVDPDDPLYQDGSQGYLDAINAPAAWDSATGVGQIIGIIDTGVDWDHPDLDDNIWINEDEVPDNGIDDDANGYVDDVHGWDFVNNDNDPNDDNSHGTHVAGIAAAEGNNGVGIVGVAFDAKIMAVKMLQSSGSGNSSDLASAIEYASENGATVINMSLGSYGESQVVKTALENAYAGTGDGEGSMLVAAAGNDHLKVSAADPCRTYGLFPNPMFPASYSWVIGVMAEDAGPCNGFSNWDFDGQVAFEGFNYEIQAQGVGVMSCKPNGSYWAKSGTSMASPEVAGAVALMRQHKPDDNGEEIFAKLIQVANSGLMDIYSSMTTSLVPNLYYIDYTIVDTLPGCDSDGIADAGETIQLYLTIKNVGGQADSVWTKIRFSEFEDPNTANFIDTTSFIGSMSAYSTMTGELDPYVIEIDSSVVNNRDIVFEYEAGFANPENPITGLIILKVQNGEELLGVMDTTLTLSADKLWIINNSFQVGANGILIVEQGVKLIINSPLNSFGEVHFNGTKESRIIVTGTPSSSSDYLIKSTILTAEYVNFENIQINKTGFVLFRLGEYPNSVTNKFSHCRFKNIFFPSGLGGLFANNFQDNLIEIRDCTFEDLRLSRFAIPDYSLNTYRSNFNRVEMFNNYFATGYNFKNCNVSTLEFNYMNSSNGTIIIYSDPISFRFNNFITNNSKIYMSGQAPGIEILDSIYWGTTKNSLIDNKITDFWDDANLRMVDYSGKLIKPSDSAHGCVWKVEIDGIDPQDEVLDPLGTGTYQFDVYFNKCMDTTFAPRLSFGVRDPHVQHIVADSAHWSTDSTIWTAYKTIGVETGDGINYIRVDDAVDTAGFDIPSEDNKRFQFIIQAAGAASIDFFATAGIGKVELEWPAAHTQDILGYNLYRFYNLTDSTFSDTTRINTELILDTLYTDFNVIPDSTYRYLYTILGTDMSESDYSKRVSATPFSAANGDANGDMAVNVLDITSIVAYMLNQNPTPFLFDAADINGDFAINVLDIIGVVGIMNGTKSAPISKLISLSNQTASISVTEEGIILKSEGNLAALQFELKGKTSENLKMISALKGFEFASVVEEDKIIGILFSFTGKLIPEGTFEIIKFDKSVTDLVFSEAIGGDLEGQYVPVNFKGGTNFNQLNELNAFCSPNPFSGSTQIQYGLDEFCEVSIGIYDFSGKLIKAYQMPVQPKGDYSVVWQGSPKGGTALNNGVYFCRIQARSILTGSNRQANLKLVLIR